MLYCIGPGQEDPDFDDYYDDNDGFGSWLKVWFLTRLFYFYHIFSSYEDNIKRITFYCKTSC